MHQESTRFANPVGTGNRNTGLAPILFLLISMLMIPGLSLGQTLNPLEADPRAASFGGSLFRAQCATCHGADAKGIQGIQAPDLTQLWSQPGKNDGSVFLTIRNGVPGSIMPPHSFTDTEIWMLVSYLKSLGGGVRSANFTGNSQRGAELFASNCADCHRVRGEGGMLGPDLSRITARISKETLVASVREPSTVLARGYRPVTLVTRDNQRIQGTIKSEDAFSIQIMDSTQNLRGFQKSALVEVRREQQSLMPAFDSGTLSDAQLEDILSFLAGQSASSVN